MRKEPTEVLPGSPLGRLLCRLVPALIGACLLSSLAIAVYGLFFLLPVAALSGMLLVAGIRHESRHEAPRPGESCFY